MFTKRLKAFIYILLAFIFSLWIAGQANAQLVISLDNEFSNPDPDPQGPTPWATATFTDLGGNNVQLTMSTSNLVDNEFIGEWLFNFDPDLTLSDLSITYNSGTGATSVNALTNNYKADGDGNFDIQFLFANSGEARFQAGETSVYDISYSGAGTMNTSSFNFYSSEGGGRGTYHSAAQVQGITADDYSGWIGDTQVVPEPVSSTLFIVGGVTLGFNRFRKKFKK
jgi:hypothetical protein